MWSTVSQESDLHEQGASIRKDYAMETGSARLQLRCSIHPRREKRDGRLPIPTMREEAKYPALIRGRGL